MPHRSPIIFWLLVAATFAVDAVAVAWIFDARFHEASATLYLGLVYGQLSLACLWVVLRTGPIGWRWIVPFFGGFLAGLLAHAAGSPGRPPRLEEFWAFVGLFWIHVVAALTILWLLKPTPLLRGARSHGDQTTWRFSIYNLLIVTTVSAVLLALLGRNSLLEGVWDSLLVVFGGNLALLLVVMGVCRASWPWLLRLAGSFGAALVLGIACDASDTAFTNALNFKAFHLIQATVIWAWLEMIAIIPPPGDDAGEADEARRLTLTRSQLE